MTVEASSAATSLRAGSVKQEHAALGNSDHSASSRGIEEFHADENQQLRRGDTKKAAIATRVADSKTNHALEKDDDDLEDSESHALHDYIFNAGGSTNRRNPKSMGGSTSEMPNFMVGQFPRIRKLGENGKMIDMISDAEASERSARRTALRRTLSDDGISLGRFLSDDEKDQSADASIRSGSTRRRKVYDQKSISSITSAQRRIDVPKLGRSNSVESLMMNGQPLLSPRRGGKRDRPMNVDKILHRRGDNDWDHTYKNKSSPGRRNKQLQGGGDKIKKFSLRRTDGAPRLSSSPLTSSPKPKAQIVDDKLPGSGSRRRRSRSSERRHRAPGNFKHSGHTRMGHQVKIPGREENPDDSNHYKSKPKQSTKKDGSETSSKLTTDSSSSTHLSSPLRKPKHKLVLNVAAVKSPKPPMRDDRDERGSFRHPKESSARSQRKSHNLDDDDDSLDPRDLPPRRRSHKSPRSPSKKRLDPLDLPSRQRRHKSPSNGKRLKKKSNGESTSGRSRKSRTSHEDNSTSKRSSDNGKSGSSRNSRRSRSRNRTRESSIENRNARSSTIAALSIPNIGADSSHHSNNKKPQSTHSKRAQPKNDEDDNDSPTELGASFVADNDLLQLSADNLGLQNRNDEPGMIEVVVVSQSQNRQSEREPRKLTFPSVGLPQVREMDLDRLRSTSKRIEPMPLYFAQQRISHRAGHGRNYKDGDDEDTIQKNYCRGEDFDRRKERRRPYPDVIVGEGHDYRVDTHQRDSLLYTCSSCQQRMACETGTIALRCPHCRSVLLPE